MDTVLLRGYVNQYVEFVIQGRENKAAANTALENIKKLCLYRYFLNTSDTPIFLKHQSG